MCPKKKKDDEEKMKMAVGNEESKEVPKSYERLQELANKAKVEVGKILKIIGKEADLSSKLLKGKLDIHGIDSKVEKKYIQLGKEAYNLVEEGKIDNGVLVAIVEEINKFNDDSQQKHEEIKDLKQKMKDATKAD